MKRAVLFCFSQLFGLLEICNQAFDHRTSHRQKKSGLRRNSTAGALCFSASLCLPCGDLLLHLPNQLGQLLLTPLHGAGVDIAGQAFSVDGGGVSAFPDDGSGSGVGLSVARHQTPALSLVESSVYIQGSFPGIEVRPPQSADLTQPRAVGLPRISAHGAGWCGCRGQWWWTTHGFDRDGDGLCHTVLKCHRASAGLTV